MNSTKVEPNKTTEVSLKSVYEKYGLRAGTCLNTYMLNNPDYAQTIIDQFNSITMENDMKPDYILDKDASIECGEIVVSFNQNMLTMLKWAREHGMAVRGHTIIWHGQTPRWLFYENFDANGSLADRATMLARMESFIRQVFEKLQEQGYAEMFYAYDVVNEAWMEDGKLREESLWKQTIGDDYLWHAFNFARQYAPKHIDLYYNDYNEQQKTEALIKFVDTLRDASGQYLLDGLGLQAHLNTSDNLDEYFAMLDGLAETGLKLQITELDVNLGEWKHELPANEENFLTQGRFYYTLINGFIERIAAGKIKSDAITLWGFNDAISWRRSGSPQLFDIDNKPKYAFYGATLDRERAGF